MTFFSLSLSTFFPCKSFYIFLSNIKSITKYPNTFDFFLCLLLFCLFGISVGFCAISTKSVTSIRSVVSKSYFVLWYNHLLFFYFGENLFRAAAIFLPSVCMTMQANDETHINSRVYCKCCHFIIYLSKRCIWRFTVLCVIKQKLEIM